MYFPKFLHLYIIYTVTTFKYTDFQNIRIRTGILDYPRESFPWLAWPLEIIGFIEALWRIYGGFMRYGRFMADLWRIYKGFMDDL